MSEFDNNDAREKRNAVFHTATGIPASTDSRMPSVSSDENLKVQFGLEIPVESVPLVSKGKIYGQESPLYSQEFIDIKAMTAREEDILTSRALIKKGTVITELIRSCIVDKRIDPSMLISGDRNTLMVAIRITGYGESYETDITCSECKAKYKHNFNLSELPIKFLEIDPIEPGKNLFSFTLPKTGKVVNFKFLTGKDEEEILAMTEKMKKHGLNSDSTVTTGLIYSIVSIDNDSNKGNIVNFIRNMPARDSLALRSYIKENDPGVQMKQETICTSCNHTEEVSMPIGTGFFWPGTE